MADHIYVGSGKARSFDNGGSVITVSIDVDKLIAACKDYGFNGKAGNRYIKLKVGERREIDAYGNTHSVEVDTWKPDAQNSAPPRQPPKAPPAMASAPPDYPDDVAW